MTTQIAVKLPDRLVSALDRLVAEGTFDSRSDAVRAAIATLVRIEERGRVDAAFAEGFTRTPDDGAELEEARRLAVAAIEDEPWERWW